MEELTALCAEPRNAIEFALFSWAFNHKPDASRGPAWRMGNVLRQQEDIAFVDPHLLFLSRGVNVMDKDVSLELIENLIPGIDVEIVPGVGAFDNLKDEV
jgi:hypothetical protein